MKKQRTVTAIDVGTTKICTITATVEEQRQYPHHRHWYRAVQRDAKRPRREYQRSLAIDTVFGQKS